MAATVDYLFAFAATTHAVRDHHFEPAVRWRRTVLTRRWRGWRLSWRTQRFRSAGLAVCEVSGRHPRSARLGRRRKAARKGRGLGAEAWSRWCLSRHFRFPGARILRQMRIYRVRAVAGGWRLSSAHLVRKGVRMYDVVTSITGHCLCGATRYSFSGPMLWRAHCHCESCRRNTSSPITTFFAVTRNQFAGRRWPRRRPRATRSWRPRPTRRASSSSIPARARASPRPPSG
jgi:hypothetical protein